MHRTEIDGLRAIAVIAVIINHIDKTLLPNGHLGVDIFYIISGFVITQSLISREYSSFRCYILGFYTRRVKRLVPALFLCITITSIFVLLVIHPNSSLSASSLRTGRAALFGFSNFYLMQQATDYFGSSAELNPFTHTWSLGVEEQFYLLFPFLLWLSGLPQKKNQGSRNFYLIIGTSATVSLISYIWLNNVNPIKAFYLMPTRFWELASGAIVYLTLIKSQNAVKICPKFMQYITELAFPALLITLFLPQPSSQEFATFTVVILTSILIFGNQPTFINYKILTLKPLVFLGCISYSLYLWHWSVLTISRLTIGVTFWTIPFQLGIILLFAFLSYQFVEQPLRRCKWNILRIGSYRLREIDYAIIFAISLTIVIMNIARPLHQQGYLYSGTTAPLIKKGVRTLKDNQTYKGFTWTANKCTLSSNKETDKNIGYENCTFGNLKTAKRRFLVIGNSFSAAEIEMYKILVEKERGAVTITSVWGASAVPEIKNKGSWNKANNYYWNSVIPALLEELKAGDMLLMINDGAGFSPKKFGENSEQQINALQKGLIRISKEMLNRGIFVIFQSSNPFMCESGCTPDTAMPQWWHLKNEPPCTYYTREESLERRRIYHNSLLSLQDQFENFAVLDLFNIFCPNELCKFYNNEGIFLYRDEWSHPSVEASSLAQPLLLETVDKLIKKNL